MYRHPRFQELCALTKASSKYDKLFASIGVHPMRMYDTMFPSQLPRRRCGERGSGCVITDHKHLKEQHCGLTTPSSDTFGGES